MNISRLKMNHIKAVALAASAMILLGVSSSVQADMLIARPLTPQEIHDNHLAAGTIASGGLFTVGIEEPVYLEVLIDVDKTVTGAVMWYLTEAPVSSAATIAASPIPMSMDIYSPPMRDNYNVADRKMLVPDVAGSYKVEVVIPTDAGSVELSTYVSGANYVGSGLVNDAAWTGPFVQQGQCAACHILDGDDKVADYTMTGHATFLEEAVDGIKSSHYSENCIECHVLGGHNPDATNGNFFNAADAAGWSWPAVLQPGNWAAMPLSVKAKANIQCEHCHGAGSEHYSRTNKNQISISFDSGDCGQCHDEEPYHNRNRQWENSGHASEPARASGSCAGCHTGEGFINRFNPGSDEYEVVGQAITCAACHDPHSNAGGEHQLRNVSDVTFLDGETTSMGGNGKFCMNCHKSRRVGEEYAVIDNLSSHFGPHHSTQGDVFFGTNAIEYDGAVMGGPTVHAYILEDTCVTCHMGSAPSAETRDLIGGHTFAVEHDGMQNTALCNNCHGNVESFDINRGIDYNYDGVAEGLQTEVHHLLDALGMYLPPVGSPEVSYTGNKADYTPSQVRALYNYMTVEEDGSFGIHNPRYITNLLRASINDVADPLNSVLNGVNIPVGGPWFYSSWFEFYSPLKTQGWIYHFTHGYLNVKSDSSGNLLIWDAGLGKWVYTNADLYPVMLDVESGTWMYFQGKYGDSRYFYNYGSGQWDIVE